jgi:hypothetical protein
VNSAEGTLHWGTSGLEAQQAYVGPPLGAALTVEDQRSCRTSYAMPAVSSLEEHTMGHSAAGVLQATPVVAACTLLCARCPCIRPLTC